MVPTESDRFPKILHLTLDGETPLSPSSGIYKILVSLFLSSLIYSREHP